MQNLAEGPQASIFHRLPAEMRALPQWCVTAGTATDKAPYGADGKRARTTDPSTWMDFATACRLATEWRGLIGFVLSANDPFACIDLDVKDDTTAEDMERFKSIVTTFNSYSELSRSGRGMHIWVRGNIGPGCKRGGVEVYSQERFIICTGSVYIDAPVEDRQELLANMVTQMRPADYTAAPFPDAPEKEEDTAIIERAKGAANGEKFLMLANGQWEGRYTSQSEADMALMSIIAFYSPNSEQCRRIFRRTELGKREKATKDDRYLNLTLEPIRRRQAAEAQRTEVQRSAFKQAGDGVGTALAAMPPSMDIKEMHRGLVYIAAEKPMIAFRDNLAVQLPPPGMSALLKHNTTTIVSPEGETVASTFAMWMGSDKRMVAYTLTFDPSAGEFCTAEDGRHALNLWKPRPHNPPADWQQRLGIFLDHIAFLIPDEAERNRFLDWLAHIEQHPGVLPHNHYLMIATQQGVGRNWLAALLAHVWSGNVAMDFDLKSSLSSGFNGQLSRKLLAVVDEINEGGTGERWQHSEKLKSMVTASHRFINVKYGLQHTEKNCCRWLLFSNYETALPLTVDDRRWNVIRNPSEPHSGEGYYRSLYSTLYPKPDPLFIASVRQFLRARNIAAFNPGAHAARNDAKEAVIANSRTRHDEVALELVASHPRELITAEDLFSAVFDVDPNFTPDAGRKWALLLHIARKAGIEPLPKPFALYGRPKVKVWALRNAQGWRGALAMAVEAELNRITAPEAPLSPPA